MLFLLEGLPIASTKHQTSKLTTTFGGLGSLCLVPFSPRADSPARTHQLLLFHREQTRQGPGQPLEVPVKFHW